MKQHTTKELISNGYKIENALIKSVDISMAEALGMTKRRGDIFAIG